MSTQTISSESMFNQPIFSYKQAEGLGITIEQYHLTPNDAEFSPLPTHLISWNLGEKGNLIRVEDGHTHKALMMKGGTTLTPARQPRHWHWDHSTDVLLLQL